MIVNSAILFNALLLFGRGVEWRFEENLVNATYNT